MVAVSTTTWMILMSMALLAGAGAVVLVLRARPRVVGVSLLILCLAALAGAWRGYRVSARLANAEDRYHAGLDEKRHGNLEEAERAMQDALALNPGHPDAKRELEALSQPAQAAPRRESRVQFQPDKGDEPGRRPPELTHKPSACGIESYHLDVTLDPAHRGLRARADLTLKGRENSDHIELALSPQFKVESVQVSGAPAVYRHKNDLLDISTSLRKDSVLPVTVRYARQVKTLLLDGGDLIDTRGVYLRPESRWYPSTGELDFHAPILVAARVPRGMTVVCAGMLARKDVGPADVTFHWQSAEPVQMICLAAGKYQYVKSATGPVTIETYLSAVHAGKARAYHEETARILRFCAERYGPYPYPKLAIAEIPVFPGGYGSSSLLLLTDSSFAQKKVPIDFLAHELAHQWWGNRIAPEGMGAGWLAEAFAEYSAVLYAEHTRGPAGLAEGVRRLSKRYHAAMARGVEQPIAETDPYSQVGCYEGVIYFKGAYVLHSLRCVVGDEAFRRILRTFADRFGGKRAGIADFETVAAEVHGKSLQWFFDQWLRRRGALRLKYATRTEGGETTLTVAQEGEPYRGAIDVVVTDSAGKSTRTLNLEGPRSELRFPAHGEVTSVFFDPANAWLKFVPRGVKEL